MFLQSQTQPIDNFSDLHEQSINVCISLCERESERERERERERGRKRKRGRCDAVLGSESELRFLFESA